MARARGVGADVDKMNMIDLLEAHDTHLRQLMNAIDMIISADKPIIEIISQIRPLDMPMSEWDAMMRVAQQHDRAKELIFEAVSLMRDDFGKIIVELENK